MRCPDGRRRRGGLGAVSLVALLAGSLQACGPPDIQGPQTVRVLVYDSTRARFQLADRTLDTIADLTTLRGETTEMRTGARLVVDARDEALFGSCSEFAGSFVEDGGRRPSLSFIDHDGVWVAEDFDSLLMVSTYFNFELAREFFILAGVSPSDLTGTTTFYEPTLIAYDESGGRSFGFDNAAFIECISSFMIFAGDRLQDIPLGANPGVAAHEYAHLVFDRLVLGPDYDVAPEGLEAIRLLDAVNEGLADFFGAAVLGDPNFAARSLTRSLSKARDLSPGTTWRRQLETDLIGADIPNPYALGTVWGSFFWDIGQSLGRQPDAAAALALEALRLINQRRDVQAFTTETMLNAVLAAAQAPDDSGETLTATCKAVADRFGELRLLTSPCPR